MPQCHILLLRCQLHHAADSPPSDEIFASVVTDMASEYNSREEASLLVGRLQITARYSAIVIMPRGRSYDRRLSEPSLLLH